MKIKVLQLHKRSVYEYKYIQDKYAFDSKKKVFALADGTTQSFRSEIWADMLVNSFINHPTFDIPNLISLFSAKAEEYRKKDFLYNSHPAKASLEKTKQQKGATATFLGVKLDGYELQIIACGDTNLFIWDKKQSITSAIPYSAIDSLDANNIFLNTNQLIEEKTIPADFGSYTHTLKTMETIILATDALSRLFLKSPNALSDFLKITDFSGLHKYCLKHWENKSLQEDDISAIIVDVNAPNSQTIIVPAHNFSFPKEVEPVFNINPTIENESKQTNMQMQEIRSLFSHVIHSLNQTKKCQRQQQILIYIIIGLLCLNIAMSTYNYLMQTKTIENLINVDNQINNREEDTEKETNKNNTENMGREKNEDMTNKKTEKK